LFSYVFKSRASCQLAAALPWSSLKRRRLTESAPRGCCKSADLAVKLPGGSSEAAHGKKKKKLKKKERKKVRSELKLG